MKYKHLTIVATRSILTTFQTVQDSDEAIRQLLRESVDDIELHWFADNAKLIKEGGIGAEGLDCIIWPELKLLAKDGTYTSYPIEVIPAEPDYCFICCSADPTTTPERMLLFIPNTPSAWKKKLSGGRFPQFMECWTVCTARGLSNEHGRMALE